MNGEFCTVLKNGAMVHVAVEELSNDDLVVLQTGDFVPADLRLVEARGLQVDEFDLTGEILPVAKNVTDEGTVILRGSRVVRGSATGIVIAVGDETEFGKILAQFAQPFQSRSINIFDPSQLGWLALLLPVVLVWMVRSNIPTITWIYFLIAVLVLLVLLNRSWFENLFVTKELIEAKQANIQINDPGVFQTLNELEIFCFDKTGVLTTRNTEVTQCYLGKSLQAVNTRSDTPTITIPPLIRTGAALCHDVLYIEKRNFADPVDRSLLSFAERYGANLEELNRQYQRIYDLPFESENRYMISGYETQRAERWYFAKGDPPVLLKKCDRYAAEDGSENRLDISLRFKIDSICRSIREEGDTPILLAYANGQVHPQTTSFVFLCVFRLQNTLQPGAAEIIHTMIEKGIRPLMLTGDRAETALSIATQCGMIENSKFVLNGHVIQRMDMEEVGRQAQYCSVFAKLTPSQKGMIIRQLQYRGQQVGMIGDGVNDGIALKVADVSVSFFTESSPIARQHSKLLIQDLYGLGNILEASTRFARRIRWLNRLRIGLIGITYLVVYAWVWR